MFIHSKPTAEIVKTQGLNCYDTMNHCTMHHALYLERNEDRNILPSARQTGRMAQYKENLILIQPFRCSTASKDTTLELFNYPSLGVLKGLTNNTLTTWNIHPS